MNESEFSNNKLENAENFIEFWSKYYKYAVKDESEKYISYIEELNLNSNLTEQNVKRLLRWKDSHMLTDKIRSGANAGNDNDRVMRVLNELKSLNDFRHGRIPETDFFKKVKDIFPNGFVWQVFLFHIARPSKYPIADQNVFRAFFILKDIKKDPTKADWDDYIEYKNFFFDIAKSVEPQGDEKNIRNIVEKLKKLDNALFEFGKFLKRYNR